MCKNWPDFPIGVRGATGGLIGHTVIICGGSDGSSVDECYSLTSEKATFVAHMSVRRWWAASVVVNGNTLWVTGGLTPGGYNGNTLSSTEYVEMTGTKLGPDLPLALFRHAMVAINSTCSMVIGSFYENYEVSAVTFYYDHDAGDWINGPSLMQARYSHAAGIVTDEVTFEQFVVVTGGYDIMIADYLDSTEILQDGEWVHGKKIYLYQILFSRFFLQISMKKPT